MHLAGLAVDDKVVVADGLLADGEFEESVEVQASAAAPTAVEPEDELVEVAGQASVVPRALVGSPQPPLGRRATRCTVGSSSSGSSPTARAGMTAPLVDIAERVQSAVTGPAVEMTVAPGST